MYAGYTVAQKEKGGKLHSRQKIGRVQRVEFTGILFRDRPNVLFPRIIPKKRITIKRRPIGLEFYFMVAFEGAFHMENWKIGIPNLQMIKSLY